MFIGLMPEGYVAPEERDVLSANQRVSLLRELQRSFDLLFYKHLSLWDQNRPIQNWTYLTQEPERPRASLSLSSQATTPMMVAASIVAKSGSSTNNRNAFRPRSAG